MDKQTFASEILENAGPQNPDAYFDQIRKDGQIVEKKIRELTVDEERKMQDGFAVDEMMKSAGWSIVNDILIGMPSSHIDPRGMNEDEWKFAELNAFWQGQVAKELVDGLHQLVRDSHELHRIKLGEVEENQKMRI